MDREEGSSAEALSLATTIDSRSRDLDAGFPGDTRGKIEGSGGRARGESGGGLRSAGESRAGCRRVNIGRQGGTEETLAPQMGGSRRSRDAKKKCWECDCG